jgi:hypothetical protein
MADYSEKEKKVLELMFKNFNNVIEACGGYFEFDDGEIMDRNDLFNLACKLDVDY